MATRSSTLAWRIPRREEPDGLESMGLQRVRHKLSKCTKQYLLKFPYTKVYFYYAEFSFSESKKY